MSVHGIKLKHVHLIWQSLSIHYDYAKWRIWRLILQAGCCALIIITWLIKFPNGSWINFKRISKYKVFTPIRATSPYRSLQFYILIYVTKTTIIDLPSINYLFPDRYYIKHHSTIIKLKNISVSYHVDIVFKL